MEIEANYEDDEVAQEIINIGDNNEDEEADPPSVQDAFDYIECVRRFLTFQTEFGDDSAHSSLVQLENGLYDALVKSKSSR